MKRFVLEVLLFGLLTLVGLVAAELYVRSLPNPARDKYSWMLKHANEVETLILGSSHTFYGINPELMGDKAYSLAMVSQTYRYDDWLLKRQQMPNLKTVILPFSYFSLYEDYETGIGEDYISRYRIYMDCPLHSVLSKYNFEFMDFYGFKEKLKSLCRKQRMTWNEYGWGSNYTLSNRSESWDNGEERAKVNTYADTSAVVLNIGFLSDIFEWGKQHNVHILLISTPLSERYRMSMNRIQVERNHRVLRKLLADYPQVEYINYESDRTFKDQDFYDADHLSDVGAKKLTLLLKNRMILNGK